MKRIVKVFKGAVIPTQTGFLRVTSWNCAFLVYCEEFYINEFGDQEFMGERMLTLEEIALGVHRVDGLNHKAEISEFSCDEV